MLNRKGAQPLLCIDERFHGGDETTGGIVCGGGRVNEIVNVSVIIGRAVNGASQIIVAIASEFLNATGYELIHDAPGLVAESSPGASSHRHIIELKPRLQFIQIAVGIIREHLID